MSKPELCDHGMYGTLCHRCHPDMHTYCITTPDNVKIFVCPSDSAAVERGKRMGAVAVYRRIYNHQVEEAGGGGDVEREVPDDDIQI